MVHFIHILSFTFFNIFIFANSEIINNPNNTYIQSNPKNFYISFNTNQFDFNSGNSGDNHQEAISTHTETISIIEDNNIVKFDENSYTHSSNIFLCSAQNNNKYLYVDYNLYKITQINQGIITQMTYYKSIPNNGNYLGYIRESNNEGNSCEIILYGINHDKIIFYYMEAEENYDVSFENKINSLSCKLIKSSFYLCAFDQSNQVNVIILRYFSL